MLCHNIDHALDAIIGSCYVVVDKALNEVFIVVSCKGEAGYGLEVSCV